MSGSPKCCLATIAEERRRALEAARRVRERLESVERERAVREHRSARKQELSAHVQATLHWIGGKVAGASTFGFDETSRLETEHRHLLISADSATDFEALSRLESEVDELAGRVRALLANDQAQLLSHSFIRQRSDSSDASTAIQALAAADAQLSELRVLAESEDARGGTRFDEVGRKKFQLALDAADAALVREDVDLLHARLSKARLAYREYSETARTSRRDWKENYHTCRSKFEEVQALASVVRIDEAIRRWSADLIAEAGLQLANAERALDAGQWSVAVSATSNAKRMLESAVVEASEREAAETERLYIVKSLLNVLSTRFDCDQPSLVQGEGGSTVVVRARGKQSQGSQRAVEVRVSPNGGLEYAVEGYQMRNEIVDGVSAASCDEAEKEIRVLHRELRERCAIETTELEWDGKPARGESTEAAESKTRQKTRRRNTPSVASTLKRNT